MQIHHPTKGSRDIPAIDFTDLWRRQGWQAAPITPDNTSSKNPTPKLIEPPPLEPALYDPVADRTAELEALLASEGWDEIKRIAESFDPPVPKADTWGKTIPDIVKRELSDDLL